MKLEGCVSDGEYGLSKDLDVVLWNAHRQFHEKSPLKNVTDFVIVDAVLHKEFDSFKASTVQQGSSFVPINELLSLYCSQSSLKFSIIQMFGYSYVHLTSAQIDLLIDWILEIRNEYYQGDVLDIDSLLSTTKG